MKVAIVHYWLVGLRGGEKVIEKLLELYPDATLITHVHDPEAVKTLTEGREVRETFVGRLPGAKRHYQKYLPLMPRALEQVDMSEFDLIISSESGPAKGIIPRPDATHVCYCHTPMRYIWDHYHVYRNTAGRLTRAIMPLLAHHLRIWDVTSAARVDHFVANSSFTAQRINSYYRREAEVIAPPVAIDDFVSGSVGDHYLMAGELVSYKRPDLAIEAFTRSNRKLTVVGDGEVLEKLKAQAGANVRILGRVSFEQLKEEFAKARALIFPGEEDFGIVPLEVMACGRPVVAYGRGGALDYVVPGKTGVFFDRQTPEALNAAIDALESHPSLLDQPEIIRAHAANFHGDVFKAKIKSAIDAAMAAKGTRV
ncbi:glycosyltransferase [Tateyamaria sp. Alg231-49]|uniref:glycosyltransferase n=1 Tax=Tateyamaria sp. Alg231-49 TaxID=1922219 RepID=UPI000D55FD94|nr:glycosyltransferase [Tateyamaria sp. Alg231-49]